MSANAKGIYMPRKERAERVRRLKDAGLTFQEIAAYMGIARSTVTSAYYDPSGAQDRARKAKHGGRCKECGESVSYKTGGTSERCDECNRRHTRTMEYRRQHGGSRRKRWSDAAIAIALRGLAHGAPLSANQYEAAYAQAPRGSMPSLATVVHRYDRWVDALAAAGVTPAGRRINRQDRTTREGCLLAVIDCAAEIGHTPSLSEYADWAYEGGAPSAELVRMRWDGWMAVAEACEDRRREQRAEVLDAAA